MKIGIDYRFAGKPEPSRIEFGYPRRTVFHTGLADKVAPAYAVGVAGIIRRSFSFQILTGPIRGKADNGSGSVIVFNPDIGTEQAYSLRKEVGLGLLRGFHRTGNATGFSCLLQFGRCCKCGRIAIQID